ncbi:hypothetical protein PGT21_014068 [Puccinia graminis f. sp. tritici]|uniref:Uncharacterized protein n=1 Tax=Puccinia graminis f. sp. tritici TaxID=56615 RepID=A0A5B0MC06_PUCGR|nr:hypothetical protein PGT21_014068 [Puccinia graminis f. sp. tritici]
MTEADKAADHQVQQLHHPRPQPFLPPPRLPLRPSSSATHSKPALDKPMRTVLENLDRNFHKTHTTRLSPIISSDYPLVLLPPTIPQPNLTSHPSFPIMEQSTDMENTLVGGGSSIFMSTALMLMFESIQQISPSSLLDQSLSLDQSSMLMDQSSLMLMDQSDNSLQLGLSNVNLGCSSDPDQANRQANNSTELGKLPPPPAPKLCRRTQDKMELFCAEQEQAHLCRKQERDMAKLIKNQQKEAQKQAREAEKQPKEADKRRKTQSGLRLTRLSCSEDADN